MAYKRASFVVFGSLRFSPSTTSYFTHDQPLLNLNMAAASEYPFATGSQGCSFSGLTEELVTPHGCRADSVGAYFHVDTAEPSLYVECTRHRTVVDAREFSKAKARALARIAMRTAIMVDGFASVEDQYTETPVVLTYAAVRTKKTFITKIDVIVPHSGENDATG